MRLRRLMRGFKNAVQSRPTAGSPETARCTSRSASRCRRSSAALPRSAVAETDGVGFRNSVRGLTAALGWWLDNFPLP
jgi:hypothetical protein